MEYFILMGPTIQYINFCKMVLCGEIMLCEQTNEQTNKQIYVLSCSMLKLPFNKLVNSTG